MAHVDIDQFVVQKKLAESERGILFSVKPWNLNRTYALKLSKPPGEKQLLTERSMLEKLGNHPNITNIYFTGEFQGSPYIVEELAEMSLRSLLDNSDGSGIALPTALSILEQIIAATAFAHENTIIHRDLKPDNILLTPKKDGCSAGTHTGYNVSICDFGLAESKTPEGIESSLEDATSAAGTIQYLSPEQKHGGAVDYRSDLYTIGLIFYEMLTGRKPSINLSKPTEINSSLPAWVDDFVLRCLRDDPSQRFQTAKEMQAAIAISTQPPKEPVPTLIQSLASKSRAGTKKLLKGFGLLLKHACLSPLYLLCLPFFTYYWLMKWDNTRSRYDSNEGLIIICSLVLSVTYYFWALPLAGEHYLRYQLTQHPASGTIIFYTHKEDGRGFTFIDASELPEIKQVFISTPEISQKEFTPQYAFDGNAFYYTTPTELIRVDLLKIGKTSDYKSEILRSEVFSYFSALDIKNGELYARLKNETWLITKEGKLQPSSITIASQTPRINNNGYVLDYNSLEEVLELQADNLLLGNFDLGKSSASAFQWLPAKSCLFIN